MLIEAETVRKELESELKSRIVQERGRQKEVSNRSIKMNKLLLVTTKFTKCDLSGV